MSSVSVVGVVGKRKTTLMNAIHSTLVAAIGALNTPSENGPGLKLFVPR